MRQIQSVAAVPAIAMTLLFSACVSTPVNTTPSIETVQYRCADNVGMSVTYSGRSTGLEGKAEMVWDGRSFPLKQEVSGSGARYTDGVLILVTKGDEAFVEKSGETVLKDCNAKS